MRAERGKDAACPRVHQCDAHHRVGPTQRRILYQHRKALLFQPLNPGQNAWIFAHHFVRHISNAISPSRISRFTARSKISDRHCTCASASVLPALMPLLTNRFSIRLDGKYTTSPSDCRTNGSEQIPRCTLPELMSYRCEPCNSPSG